MTSTTEDDTAGRGLLAPTTATALDADDQVDNDDPRRLEVRRWLAEHPHPSGRDLAAAGWVAPHWPAPWGRGADPRTSSSSTTS